VNRRNLRDRKWLKRPPFSSGRLRAWLTDRGSLTSRIVARCPAFSVKLLFQGRRRVSRDERFVSGGARRALVREVYLYCRRTPVVFAHSVLDARELRGTWRSLARLGTRPLGAALFANPLVRRYPLHYKRLNRGHELHRRACKALGLHPEELWARRSLFMLKGSPILVTEVFLPGVLKL
jgi:chorismate--pyruvate lyase